MNVDFELATIVVLSLGCVVGMVWCMYMAFEPWRQDLRERKEALEESKAFLEELTQKNERLKHRLRIHQAEL